MEFEQMFIDAGPGKQGEAMEIMKRAADDGWRLASPYLQTIIIMQRPYRIEMSEVNDPTNFNPST